MHIRTWPVDAMTRLVGILGYPISHSFSPLIHNAAFFTQELNLRYVALEVRPASLSDAVKGLRALGFAGANVTIPHKQAVVPLLDDISEDASAIGAVNTIVCQRSESDVVLMGTNTDVEGFLAPLRQHAALLRGQNAVVLGAGGAARAVAYALVSGLSTREVTIAARSTDQARGLCAGLASGGVEGIFRPAPLAEAGPFIREASLIVNATPVGMHPHVAQTPWSDAKVFREGQIVYDLVYRPLQTRLMLEASERGALVIGGMGMLLRQAAEAYRLWTGQDMPLVEVQRALPQD